MVVAAVTLFATSPFRHSRPDQLCLLLHHHGGDRHQDEAAALSHRGSFADLLERKPAAPRQCRRRRCARARSISSGVGTTSSTMWALANGRLLALAPSEPVARISCPSPRPRAARRSTSARNVTGPGSRAMAADVALTLPRRPASIRATRGAPGLPGSGLHRPGEAVGRARAVGGFCSAGTTAAPEGTGITTSRRAPDLPSMIVMVLVFGGGPQKTGRLVAAPLLYACLAARGRGFGYRLSLEPPPYWAGRPRRSPRRAGGRWPS